jgi:phosphoribosylaminoimidazolecarboxamide formyltransferase/IMP cyclohydrolase
MKIRRALLSVSDKTGLIVFARALAERGVFLLSTGNTFRALREAGIEAQTVESYTGSPEVMNGRVKTLHPRVHGAILARSGVDDADLERIGALPIDLVAVNLYPFEKTLAEQKILAEQKALAGPGSSLELLIENIDIGGPCMLRAAAKNHDRVSVVCDQEDYARVIRELDENAGEVPRETRRRLAAKAFAHTAAYDTAIAEWLGRVVLEGSR